MILAIDTSCDETAAAVTDGRKVISNAIYSQVLIHKKWGGVVPSLAKRAHEERIDLVIEEVLKKYCQIISSAADSVRSFFPASAHYLRAVGNPLTSATCRKQDEVIQKLVDSIAVTYGPGLAVALEVGIKKAKELAQKFNKKLIAVNHMEGHIYSCFAQNSKGNPKYDFNFPYLALLVSGGHTELVIFKDHLKYEVIGQTIDDASGEALDKAGKLLGLGYPAGSVIEKLAKDVDNQDFYHFPRPMIRSGDLNFSFSGLKTSFYYFLKDKSENFRIQKLKELSSSFQEAVFDTILIKTEQAIKKTDINRLIVGGGVVANLYLRKKIRQLVKKYKGEVIFPPYKYLTGDNAAMIGVVAYYKAQKKLFVKGLNLLDRKPRLSL